MRVVIPDDSSLEDIYKILREKGVKNIKSKKLKFSVSEGGFGSCVVVDYEVEVNQDDYFEY